MRTLARLRRRPVRIRTMGETERAFTFSTIVANLSKASQASLMAVAILSKKLVVEPVVNRTTLGSLEVGLSDFLSDVERTWSYHHGVNCGNESFTPRAMEVLRATERLQVACQLLKSVLDKRIVALGDGEIEIAWRSAALKQCATEFLFVQEGFGYK